MIYRLILGLTLGFLLTTTIMAGFGSTSSAIVKGDGADKVSKQVTGIYRIATLNPGSNRRYEALLLVNKGRAIEIHSRKSSGAYLKRVANSSSARLSTAKFNQLLQTAGVNIDVEKLPANKRDQFYQIAGFSGNTGGGSLPLEVVPGPNNECPSGYELKLDRKEGKMKRTCRPIARIAPDDSGNNVLVASDESFQDQHDSSIQLASSTAQGERGFWSRVRLIPSAEASLRYLRFKLSDFFQDITFTYDDGSGFGGQTAMSGWSFQGFGWTIIWVDDNP